MNVRLAAQTLSQSVSSSLLFCEELKLLSGVKPTAEFCEIINNVFDLLNCRNKLGKGNYYRPLNDANKQYISEFLIYFKKYVENLTYCNNNNNPNNEYLLKSRRKTGFLGLIICLTNLLKLYEILKPHI